MLAKSIRIVCVLAFLVLQGGQPTGALAASAPVPAPEADGVSRWLAPAGRNCGDVFWADRWLDFLPADAPAALLAAQATSRPAFDLGPSAPAAPAGERFTWTTDRDFLPGFFNRTEAPEGLGRVTLARLWRPNVRVDDDGGIALQNEPRLAISPEGRTIYAVWRDERNGQSDVCSCSSADGGQTWSKNTKINDDDSQAPQGSPSLAVGPEGQLFAAWVDGRNGGRDIFAARSLNGGVDWDDNVQVNDSNSTPYDQDQPSLAVDPNNAIYVVWQDFRSDNADIYFSRSLNGFIWSENKPVNDDNSGRSQANPSLAVDAAGRLYLAWADDRNGSAKEPDPDIYFAHSLDQGQSWSPNVRVNDDSGGAVQDHPDVAAGKDKMVFLAWQDFRNSTPALDDPDIYFARSENAGLDWGPNSRVNDDPPGAIQGFPSLAAMDGERLFLAWQDGRDSTPKAPDSDIYFARSANSGDTWMIHDRVNDDVDSTNQETPSLVVFNGEAFAIWRDARSDVGDIWSSRWPRTNAFVAFGGYAAPIFDAVNVARWDALSWVEEIQPGTLLTMTVRVGDSPIPPQGWTDWIVLDSSPANLQNLPPRQFLQWGVRLSTTDPNLTPSLEQVTLTFSTCYDFGGTGMVNLADVQMVAGRFGLALGQPGFEPRFDVDHNEVIDVMDIIWVASNWGEICP